MTTPGEQLDIDSRLAKSEATFAESLGLEPGGVFAVIDRIRTRRRRVRLLCVSLAAVLAAVLIAGVACADELPTDAAIAQQERDLRDAYELRRKAAQDAGSDAARQHWLIQRRAIELAISSRVAWDAAEPPVVTPDPDPQPDPTDAIRVAPGDSIPDAIARLEPGGTLLFQRGGTYHGGLGQWRISGLSADQPTIVGAYGEGDPPVFLTDGEGLVSASGGDEIKHVAFRDLEAVSSRRGTNGHIDEDGVAWASPGEDIRFERLVLSCFTTNIVVKRGEEYAIRDVRLDGCYLHHAFAMPGEHSQGIFIDRVQGLTIRNCILDHNGWSDRRTGFNHNAYIYQCADLLITGCMFSRGSNLGLKLRSDGTERIIRNQTVRDNLFIDCIVGMSVGSDPIDGDQSITTLDNLTIEGNVFVGIGGRLTENDNNYQGIAINLKQVDGVVVRSNIFAHQIEDDGPNGDNNWYAVEVTQWKPIRNVSLTDNIVHDWTANEPLVNAGGAEKANAVLRGNRINAGGYLDPDRGREYAALGDRVLDGELIPAEAVAWVREGFQAQ